MKIILMALGVFLLLLAAIAFVITAVLACAPFVAALIFLFAGLFLVANALERDQKTKPEAAMAIGLRKIRAERLRQMQLEGWTLAHDLQHAAGVLSKAATCYEAAGDSLAGGFEAPSIPPLLWPWEAIWWKPAKSAGRNYEKAGALFQAEVDRYREVKNNVAAGKMEIEVLRVAEKLGSLPA